MKSRQAVLSSSKLVTHDAPVGVIQLIQDNLLPDLGNDKKHKPMDVARELDRVKRMLDAGNADLSFVAKMPRSWIDAHLKLVGLHEELHDLVAYEAEGRLSVAVAGVIASVPLDKQVELSKVAVTEGMSATRLVRYIDERPDLQKGLPIPASVGRARAKVSPRDVHGLVKLVTEAHRFMMPYLRLDKDGLLCHLQELPSERLQDFAQKLNELCTGLDGVRDVVKKT